ncbi:hypothetical protein CLD20_09520 [Afifella sp. IM 167]|nr:hypothetical protein [Afifella sp. IM 167]
MLAFLPAAAQDAAPDHDPQRAMALLAELTGRWAPTDQACLAGEDDASPLLRVERGGFTKGSAQCRFKQALSPASGRLDVLANCAPDASAEMADERLVFLLAEDGALTLKRGEAEERYFRCLDEARLSPRPAQQRS